MERALFVRHGESEFSAKALVNGDPTVACGLTELGRQQARQLGERLAGEPIGLCVVTEFARTTETADLALVGREVPRLVVPELNDPFYGDFEGGRSPTTGPGRDARARRRAARGGETRLAIASRYVRGFRTLLERPEETRPGRLPLAADRLRARRAPTAAGPRAKMPLITYAEPHVLYADALGEGGRATGGLDPRPGLRMMRRLLVWGAIVWVGRWACSQLASVLERRTRQ